MIDYNFYSKLIQNLKAKNFKFVYFSEFKLDESNVILRHDVDFSIQKALEMAKIENELGIKSTYFILLRTNFYNPFSYENIKLINEIKLLNHEIGLHFDRSFYKIDDLDLSLKVNFEINILESLIGHDVTCFSFHRPNQDILNLNLKIPNKINAYSYEFFNNIKYVSDSGGNFNRVYKMNFGLADKKGLQLLIHPIWYTNKNIDSIEKVFVELLKQNLNRNLTDLKSNLKNVPDLKFIKENLND